MRARVAVASLAWVAACSGAEPAEPENPLRLSVEQSIATLDPQQPLLLRYNPAACACPALELRVGSQWLRAEVAGDAELRAWLQWLATTPPDNLPVPVQLHGKVDAEVQRTASGNYAVRVTVRKILAPLAPPATEPAR